jgi:hypothetical protein
MDMLLLSIKMKFFLTSLVSIFFITSLAHAACTNPAGTEGELIYNSTYKRPQFCDGTDWVNMVSKGPTVGGVPPTCTGAGKALQHDGTSWSCVDVGSSYDLGGVFAYYGGNSGATNCHNVNPITGSCSCPAGYTATTVSIATHDCGSPCYTIIKLCHK